MSLEKTTASVVPKWLEVEYGDPVEFTCDSTGENLDVYWTLNNDQPLPPHVTAHGPVLKIQAASMTDTTRFVCKVVSSTGKAESNGNLIVRGKFVCLFLFVLVPI